MLTAVADSLLSLIYPQSCHLCGSSVERFTDGVACAACWADTHVFNGDELLCQKCGAYHSKSGTTEATECRDCSGQSYDVARAVGIYEKALAATVLHLKTEPFVPSRIKRRLPSVLDSLDPTSETLVVPVPLSRKRHVERGFNQAETLADIIGRAGSLKVDRASLARTIHTPIHRAAMDRKAREATVRNAFAVKRPRLIEGRRILLVDDVLTSGSTASQCAKILKANGATWVGVLTIARAVRTY